MYHSLLTVRTFQQLHTHAHARTHTHTHTHVLYRLSLLSVLLSAPHWSLHMSSHCFCPPGYSALPPPSLLRPSLHHSLCVLFLFSCSQSFLGWLPTALTKHSFSWHFTQQSLRRLSFPLPLLSRLLSLLGSVMSNVWHIDCQQQCHGFKWPLTINFIGKTFPMF